MKHSTLNSPLFPVRMAAHIMHRGGVIAYPTEAVFGLGCDPLNRVAVDRLLSIKQRPAGKGLILIAAELSQLYPFILELDRKQRQRLEQSWPGAVTWTVPPRPGAAPWLRGNHDTLAVRVTAHPVAAALCRIFGGAIVSTSANPASRKPARSALATRRYFAAQLDFILHGAVGCNRNPSKICSLRDGRVLRPA